MSMPTRESDTAIIKTTAHLVVRSGLMDGTTIPLNSGQVTTIGRATTNRLVIPDEICSRNHCEVFFDGGAWKLRDLGSRNGTRINGEPITGDLQLTEGRQFQIGNTIVGFTFDPHAAVPTTDDEIRTETLAIGPIDTIRSDNRPPTEGRPEIVHLTDKTRYMSNDPEHFYLATGGPGSSTARATRVENGAETDVRRLADIVLDGLFGVTSADIGAVLLFKDGDVGRQDHRKLDVVAYKSSIRARLNGFPITFECRTGIACGCRRPRCQQRRQVQIKRQPACHECREHHLLSHSHG